MILFLVFLRFLTMKFYIGIYLSMEVVFFIKCVCVIKCVVIFRYVYIIDKYNIFCWFGSDWFEVVVFECWIKI